MSIRNILVHIDETAASRRRASAAAHIAKHIGASLTGMFLRSDFVPAFVAGDAFSAGLAIEAYIEERDANLAAASQKARATFDPAVSENGLTADWIEINGDNDVEFLATVRRFDLTVFPPVAPSAFSAHATSASHVGMSSGAPVLIIPDHAFPIPFGKRILVAWKESRESARALHDAWPFLAAAEEVHFLTIGRDAPQDFDDVMRRNLEAHGCRKFVMHADTNDDIDVGNAIQRHAGRVGADMVVLGLYGHSRGRELLLGGVSRDMLQTSQLPLLVSH